MERIILTDEQERNATEIIRGAEAYQHGPQFIGVACQRLRDGRAVKGSPLPYNARRLAADGWTWREVRFVNG